MGQRQQGGGQRKDQQVGRRVGCVENAAQRPENPRQQHLCADLSDCPASIQVDQEIGGVEVAGRADQCGGMASPALSSTDKVEQQQIDPCAGQQQQQQQRCPQRQRRVCASQHKEAGQKIGGRPIKREKRVPIAKDEIGHPARKEQCLALIGGQQGDTQHVKQAIRRGGQPQTQRRPECRQGDKQQGTARPQCNEPRGEARKPSRTGEQGRETHRIRAFGLRWRHGKNSPRGSSRNVAGLSGSNRRASCRPLTGS